MDKILRGLGVVYMCVGVVFFLVAPRSDDASELAAVATGQHCDIHSAPALILAWPYYMNYFYGGDFAACSGAKR
jgi:hypothetical protein